MLRVAHVLDYGVDGGAGVWQGGTGAPVLEQGQRRRQWRGEILALRWEDVDLVGAVPTVTISGTVVRVPGQGMTIQDHPKTAAGRRRLRIPPFLVEVLLRRQVAQVLSTAFNVVFPSAANTLRDPTNFRDQWREARDRRGMPWVIPHTFRKSVATVLATAEDSRTAAGQLGHVGTAVTEKNYIVTTHEGPDARDHLESFGQAATEP